LGSEEGVTYAFSDEVIGEVGSEHVHRQSSLHLLRVDLQDDQIASDNQHRSTGSLTPSKHPAEQQEERLTTYGQRADDSLADPQTSTERVDTVEERLLALLQILVVRGGETLERHHEARHLAEDSAGFASEELEGIGVLLLGLFGKRREKEGREGKEKGKGQIR
jgi:hypothetical protein